MVASGKDSARIQPLPNGKLIVRNRKFFTILFLCSILTASFSIIIYIKPALATTRNVPANYPTIRAAITASSPGDTIQVAPGTYREHLDVIKSLSIVGANASTTIIDGMGNGTVVILDATAITITGFTIRNAGNNNPAVTAADVPTTNDYHLIKNNILRDCSYGVQLSGSNYDTIVSNTFTNNSLTAIWLYGVTNTNVTGNTISQTAYGVRLASSSSSNIIASNVMSAIGAYGVHISSSSTSNTITRNTISARSAGIYIESSNNSVDHNTVTQSDFGIYFYNTQNGPVYYNYLFNNSRGIRLYSTSPYSGATVRNNKATYNVWGIELVSVSSTTFTGNWLQRNTYGISIQSYASNTFYHNDFVNNVEQVNSNSAEYWNTTTDGNYWSDYSGGGNYQIPPLGYDYHPLKTTWSEHDITVKIVTVSINIAYVGSIITVLVTVRNNDNITQSESFTVTAKYNSTTIGTQTVTNLAQGATQTLTFNWNTGTAGKWTIIGVTSTVTDELNNDNNQFTYGTTKILYLGDINQDGTVNLADLILLKQAYGSTPTSPNWNPNADSDKNGLVDGIDLEIQARNYGKSI